MLQILIPVLAAVFWLHQMSMLHCVNCLTKRRLFTFREEARGAKEEIVDNSGARSRRQRARVALRRWNSGSRSLSPFLRFELINFFGVCWEAAATEVTTTFGLQGRSQVNCQLKILDKGLIHYSHMIFGARNLESTEETAVVNEQPCFLSKIG